MNPCLFHSYEIENIYITGWILDFYCETKKVLKQDMSDLISEIVEVPIKIVKIDAFDGDKTKNGIIYAGIRGIKQDPNNFEVEPIVNYFFSLNGKYNEKMELENIPDVSSADYNFF